MSISQDDISELNSPIKPVPRKSKNRNKVTSPVEQSPLSNPSKKDVFEMFTIKTPSIQGRAKVLTSDSQDTSELSDEVFTKPKPVSLSTPSKSYREKINARFKNVKEKAGKSTKKANVFKEAAENIRLEKVKRESHDIDAELELMRERLKLGKPPDNKHIFEFFSSEKCHETEEKESEDNFQSTDDLTDDGPALVFSLPKQIKTLLRKSEDALFYTPQAEPVDITDKIETEEPRFLEDEGFYVTSSPKIPNKHLYLLEQRLSCDDKKWFNCDGKLNILENPCQRSSYRPRLKHLPVKEIATYLPATTESNECEEIVVVSENLLQLRVLSLKFTHHPLFSLEHVLCQKLKKLYYEYEESVTKNEFMRLCGRLEGLRRVLRRLEENSSQSGDQSDREDGKVEAYKRDIRTLQEQVFEEGKKERDRIIEILQTWKAIKSMRENNKYSNTSLKLIIKKENVNYETEKENFDKNFEETYEEFLQINREKPRRKRQTEEDIRQELVERFKESFRPPGEPILHFILTNENEITKQVENSKEVSRRTATTTTKIALKILCNKMEVCKTKWLALQDDFVCNFNETISIQLTNVPKFLTLEIIEQPKSLIKRTLGELTVKIPARSVSKIDKKNAKFEKNEIVHYKHEGVGSGIKVDSLVQNLGDFELNTSGCLTYSLSWDASVANDNSPDNRAQILGEIIDKSGTIDSEKLVQWMQQHNPDPQDPRNSILYEYSLDCGEEMVSASSKNYFRLNEQEWQFCDPKIIEDNLRFKILQLRNKNEPEFDRIVVPNRIKEIPLDVLADYRRRVAMERESLVEEDEDDDDEIEARRSKGRKLLKQIHIRVFQKCKNSENNLSFEDVVDEKFMPQLEKLIKGFGANFLSWFQWRPLKPPLFPLKTLQESKSNDYDLQSRVKINVHVISGLNIPLREGKAMPFVEIQYGNATVRTVASQGAHPNWNEKLVLPLEPSHLDYLNPNSLSGSLILNVFDESEVVLMKFAGQKGRTWLGYVEIPLSAVCIGMQGMFRVKVPHMLLGYQGKTLETTRSNSQSNQQTYLNLHVTMEPNVPKLNPAIDELPCADVPYIQDYVMKWNTDYNTTFPNRKFSVLAIDANATTSCIIRYIKPLEPPQINVEGFDVTPEQCARFVSLIPFTDCNQFYKNIWLSVDRFLHYMTGSIIDHAVALTCYLLALKLEVWLLLGFGIPHGATAYVLVKEYDNNRVANFYVYDVVSGNKIYLTDAFCPLQRVYCLVNEHNVWANIQRNDDVTVMRFDLTRRSDWLPLFTSQISAPTNSIHGKITYLSHTNTDELEIILDRKIRKRFAKLRQLDRTLWNHDVSNTFKSVLGSFEQAEMYGKSNSDALEKIKECLAGFEMRGQIFNLPFTNCAAIVKHVKTFGLHLEEDANVQFACAVYLRAYPNQVLTVWVALAVIKNKKTDDPLQEVL
ncbi:coiled-coil and C2 domain-containing protein 2A [Tribolium castaneum]|uniref:Coiled-coil and C2 domain-containing protein 2A-like Protein n=1 Tax=Tribolium castaneum TaxID=7070 RepID=D6WDX8_TRICA|nr:PREDICTED: coiled-coil and C2 domain-containing protein 2A [Tribolium castaneum]EFA01199.2 Coiled-coil and C2 domain-containing protein 2A-like Protein [Tribolium castaneum]|eukprot:XP_008199223.2 PREDICTED: coiled-coil and C2 domain-containing protein 2A [Tribolium castaneum]